MGGSLDLSPCGYRPPCLGCELCTGNPRDGSGLAGKSRGCFGDAKGVYHSPAFPHGVNPGSAAGMAPGGCWGCEPSPRPPASVPEPGQAPCPAAGQPAQPPPPPAASSIPLPAAGPLPGPDDLGQAPELSTAALQCSCLCKAALLLRVALFPWLRMRQTV